jgi:DNA-binding transcriptional LysR family regulator
VTVRVGGFPSALATLIPAAVARLGPRRVETVEGTTEELAAGVADGSLHVALAFQDAAAPPREHPGLRRHDLVEEPFVPVVGPGHRLAGRRTIRLRELASDPWTAPSTTGILHNACVAAGFEPDVRFITRDVLAIHALIAADLAVTLSSRLVAGLVPGVRVLALREEAPRRRIYALTPRSGTTAAARAFLDAVRELL